MEETIKPSLWFRIKNMPYRIQFVKNNWRKVLAHKLYEEPVLWRRITIPFYTWVELDPGAYVFSAYVRGNEYKDVVFEISQPIRESSYGIR